MCTCERCIRISLSLSVPVLRSVSKLSIACEWHGFDEHFRRELNFKSFLYMSLCLSSRSFALLVFFLWIPLHLVCVFETCSPLLVGVEHEIQELNL